ncbi:MoaD/ThiS family protein [Alicyclobacillus sp. ALC3]|uniref:MoaD/ThiS family protein n=1 Tax=Alicyclobacillus sp. ALC3 TaxID=2796143 RepID=UPI002379B6CF|nr:MoaD/ThiS family protein [Alicyclobacillus sp. ALC3]WDL95110.1 MoaD/ThiS family protein [Alicyclobacillus sp. ALC3]
MITVHLPGSLTDQFHADPVVSLPAQTLSDVLVWLDGTWPGMASWLVEPDGCFRENLSVFISGRRLPPRAHVSTPVGDVAEVWILRAISGG